MSSCSSKIWTPISFISVFPGPNIGLTGKWMAYCSNAAIGTEFFTLRSLVLKKKKKTAQYSQHLHTASDWISPRLPMGMWIKPMVTYHVVFPLTYPFHFKRYPIAPNTWSPSPADSEEAEAIKAPEKPGWARLLPPEGAVGSRSPAP